MGIQMILRVLYLITLIITLGGSLEAAPQDCALPYFASLKVGKVNLRSGPGYHYPVQWQLLRPHLPIEVLSKSNHWLRVQDIDGTVGWVHMNMVCSRKTIIFDAKTTLHEAPSNDSPIIAYIEPRVIAEVKSQLDGWCNIMIGTVQGWVSTEHVWGISDIKGENQAPKKGGFKKFIDKLKLLFS